MKNIVYYLFLFISLSFFVACSNGDYIANPSSNINGSVNPLHPLAATDFTWTGTDPLSANIDGAPFVATWATFSFDSGVNVIAGIKGNKVIYLYLTNTWAANLYNMGYHQYNSSGYYGDSTNVYWSYYGNSGGLYVLQNDTFRIKGLFYFQGINAKGEVINVSNGYFNVPKW